MCAKAAFGCAAAFASQIQHQRGLHVLGIVCQKYHHTHCSLWYPRTRSAVPPDTYISRTSFVVVQSSNLLSLGWARRKHSVHQSLIETLHSDIRFKLPYVTVFWSFRLSQLFWGTKIETLCRLLKIFSWIFSRSRIYNWHSQKCSPWSTWETPRASIRKT